MISESEMPEALIGVAVQRTFVKLVFARPRADERQQMFYAAGKPIFDPYAPFVGYRGFSIELTTRK
jgi:hypothetical protein